MDASAGSGSEVVPADFPARRFHLALMDALLDKPRYYSLSEPNFALSLDGEGSTLPLWGMGLVIISGILPERIRNDPFLKLSYDITSKNWLVEATYASPRDLPNMPPFAQGLAGQLTTDLNEGRIIEVFLPKNIGSFRFQLIDMGNNEPTRGPSIKPTCFSGLPYLPQLLIAKHLNAEQFLRSLCIADPLINVMVRQGRVSWRRIEFCTPSTPTVLDFFRVFYVAAVNALEEVEVGAVQSFSRFPGCAEHIQEKILDLLRISGTLRKVRVHHLAHLVLNNIPENVEVVEIVVDDSNHSSFSSSKIWSYVDAYHFFETTEVKISVLRGASDYQCRSIPFDLNVCFTHVTEVDWDCCRICTLLIPFQALPNLHALKISYNCNPDIGRIVYQLESAGLQYLRHLEISIECTNEMGLILEAVAKGAPGIDSLLWKCPEDHEECRFQGETQVMSSIRKLRRLESLIMEYRRTAAVEEVIRFVKGLPRIRTVTVRNVETSHQEACVLSKLQDLQDAGKRIDLEVTGRTWSRRGSQHGIPGEAGRLCSVTDKEQENPGSKDDNDGGSEDRETIDGEQVEILVYTITVADGSS